MRSLPDVSYRTCARWTATEARAALDALDASGLSVAAFSAREGLDPQRLYVWRRQLGRAARASSAAMVPARFVEIRPHDSGIRIEVVLRSGVVVRVPEAIDIAQLKRLVDALDRPAPC